MATHNEVLMLNKNGISSQINLNIESTKKHAAIFDEDHVIHELKHYLPTQTPLKDFIHHNSLHAFQHLKFYEAIFKASKIFGFQATLELKDYRELYKIDRINDAILDRIISQHKGLENIAIWKQYLLSKQYDESVYARIGRLRARWKQRYQIDIDSTVQPLLFRVFNSYLDQGISIWKFPLNEKGFLASLRNLEENSFSGFFKSKRAKALFLQNDNSISQLLQILVGDESYFEQYLFDLQFSHRGWSGMVATIEERPDCLLDTRKISLKEAILFELLLEIDALDYHLGKNWNPICEDINEAPIDLFAAVQKSELEEVLAIWQDAFEWSYYDEVLGGIAFAGKKQPAPKSKKSFQAIFCIDERECSLRRNIEHIDPYCETLGSPGFFGVEFYFQPQDGKFYDKLCPAPVTPNYLIKEFDVTEKRKHEVLYTPHTHTLIKGFFTTMILGFAAGAKLFSTIFKPKMSPAISNAFAHSNKKSKLTIENVNTDDRENNLQIGFTVDEMTNRVEGLLRGIGLIKGFADLIYLVAHGSSSANNPHHGAHDCGACSGRPGSVNARVFAFMANHKKVREQLSVRGIQIPESTKFVGALHDTAADQMEYYDEDGMSVDHLSMHQKNVALFEQALDLNAKERSRRFASINTKNGLRKVRQDIKERSVSLFEPRPELGHGTNALCIVGGRHITKDLFLDRRAFLNSYDYKTDLDGKLLVGVMRPLGPVCGGINLEYYFSRVDNHKLGAGTKLPHHVMGLIGVTNSCDGDLRPGLPLQMIEVHDPVRLLIVVEHFPDVVLKTIQSTPDMYEWFINEWVHLIALHPNEKKFYYFSKGAFIPHHPLFENFESIKDINTFIESAKEMETNYIADATKENLSVHSLN